MSEPRYAFRLDWRALKRVVGRSDLSEEDYKRLARNLGQAMVDHQITTGLRARMFIAQTCHESGGYRWREELASGANYDKAVNASLAKQLGNTRFGDGKKFKGRTYIQITGRANYSRVSADLGEDFVKHPERLADPEFAAKGAAWWWKNHGCNEAADTGDFVRVTRIINGGTNGLPDRKRFYRRTRMPRNRRGLIPQGRKP